MLRRGIGKSEENQVRTLTMMGWKILFLGATIFFAQTPDQKIRYEELPESTQYHLLQPTIQLLTLKNIEEIQKQKLIQLRDQIEFHRHDLTNSEVQKLLQSLISNALQLDQEVFDVMIAYRDLIEMPNDTTVSSFVTDKLTTLEEFDWSVKFEKSVQLSKLRIPHFSEVVPFHGLTLVGDDWDRFLQTYHPEWARKLTLEVQQNILKRDVLSFSDYGQYLEAILGKEKINAELLSISYFRYRAHRLIQEGIETSGEISRDEFVAKLQKVRDEAQRLSGIDPLYTDAEIEMELAWLILSELKANRVWNPPFTAAWKASRISPEKALGMAWVKYRFKKEPDGSEDGDRFPDIVDELVQTQYKEHLRNFQMAEAQIEAGHWAYLTKDKFRYYLLPPDLRYLLLAKIFPDLHLNQSQALIEQRLFALPERERTSLALQITPAGEALTILGRESYEKRIEDPAALRNLHANWVKLYLEERHPATEEIVRPEDEMTVVLTDGEAAPKAILTAQAEKRRMQNYLDRYAESHSLGSLTQFFALNFVPSPDFWVHEQLRFQDSWRRRARDVANLQSLRDIQLQAEKARTPEERDAWDKRFQEESENILSIWQMDPAEDASSPSVYAATLSYSSLPHSGDDWKTAGKKVLQGAGIAVLSAYVDPKLLLLLTLSDTGLRLGTASYMSPGGSLDLSRGYSTPLGLWTAEFFISNGLALQNLTDENADFLSRLESANRLGSTAGDVAFMSAGAVGSYAIASRFTSLPEILRTRRLERIERKIHRTKERIRLLRNQESALQKEISRLDGEIATESQAFGTQTKTYKRLSAQRDLMNREAAAMRVGHIGLESRARFLVKQSLRLAFGVVEFVTQIRAVLRELPSSTSELGLFKRLRRNSYWGIEQLKLRIREMEAQQTAIASKQITTPAMKKYEAAQKQLENNVRSLTRDLKNKDLPTISKIERMVSDLKIAQEQLSGSVESANSLRTPVTSKPFPKIEALRESTIQNLFNRAQRIRGERPLPKSSPDWRDANVIREHLLEEQYVALRQQWKILEDLRSRVSSEIQKLPMNRIKTETFDAFDVATNASQRIKLQLDDLASASILR